MTIENPNLNPENPQYVRAITLKKRGAMASITVAATLTLAKLVAYFVTDSVSLMSSLMDSAFDLAASAITMFSIITSASLAGKNHKYGYGKVEALAAVGQAIFILVSAVYLLIEATHRFVHPVTIVSAEFGVEVMLLSIVLTVALVAYQHYVIKQTASVAIKADHLHYKGDLLMNLGVIVALLASTREGMGYVDPVFAIAVSFILFRSAYHVFQESTGILMDKELPLEDRERILAIVGAHPDVCAVHDLRTRDSGNQVFIEFHMEVDEKMSIRAAHDITEELEKKLYAAFPTADVIIHQEPCGIDDRRIDDRI